MRNAFHIILVCSLVFASIATSQGVSTREELVRRLSAGTAEETAPETPVKCGFAAVAHAIGHRGSLSPEAAYALKSVQDRRTTETDILRGKFRIHFDTSASNLNTPALLNSSHFRIPGTAVAYAESVAAIANYVWDEETVTLGYAAPPSDGTLGGGPEYDIYISELGSLYGLTTPDTSPTEGGRAATSIEIDNDFIFVSPLTNRGLPALRVTLAHEFHHAIQIGSYGYWYNDAYFHEITSVWMEDVVYHGVNDYLNYLVASWGHFKHPDRALNARTPDGSSDLIMYSRGIWGKYLEKRFGRDVMRRMWELCATEPPMSAMDNALKEPSRNSSMRLAVAEWMIWNYFTGSRADSVHYYSEGVLFPEMIERGADLVAGAQQSVSSIEPLSCVYFQVLRSTDTVTIALANVDLASAVSDSRVAQPFTLWMSLNKLDDSYSATGSGIYLRLDVASRSQWVVWDAHRGTGISEGTVFPNPFPYNGSASLRIRANGSLGTLSIFNSAMELVAKNPVAAGMYLGNNVFSWNGRTDRGVAAASGVYIYVLDLGDHSITGKFAIVRK